MTDNPFNPGTDHYDEWERSEQLSTSTQLPDEQEAGTAFSRTLYRRSELAKLPRIQPLISGVLSLRASVVLFGPTNAGKSAVALSWACSIAMGVPWLGHKVTRLPVLYVVGEGASGYDDRVTAWETAWHTPVDDDSLIFSVKPQSLSKWTTWSEITEECLALQRRFVVLDTFSSLAPDADETKDAAPFTRHMSDLAVAIDGTVVAVHHPGWGDPDRVRGGSQLEANVDEVVKLTGNATDPNIELTRKKVKDGEAGRKLSLRRIPIQIGVNEDGEPRSSVTVETGDGRLSGSSVPKWVAEWWRLYRDGWISPSALEKDQITSSTTFHRTKWDLLDKQLVEKGGRGDNQYRLTKDPA